MTTNTDGILVKVLADDRLAKSGKLADAELHFTAGPLAGMKLVGFAIWERRSGTGRNVTFPSRTYSVNGERRSFALLRPNDQMEAADGVRALVLDAHEQFEAGQEVGR